MADLVTTPAQRSQRDCCRPGTPCTWPPRRPRRSPPPNPQQVQRAQEAPVRLMLPGHRAVAVPARAAQLVQPSVVASPGEGVRAYRVAGGECPPGQLSPGSAITRIPGGYCGGIVRRCQRQACLLIGGKKGLRRPTQQVLSRHATHPAPAHSAARTPTAKQSWSAAAKSRRIGTGVAGQACQDRRLPTDIRSSQACTTLALIDCSPALPQVRGS